MKKILEKKSWIFFLEIHILYIIIPHTSKLVGINREHSSIWATCFISIYQKILNHSNLSFTAIKRPKNCYLSMSTLCKLNSGVKIILNLDPEIMGYDISLPLMTISVFLVRWPFWISRWPPNVLFISNKGWISLYTPSLSTLLQINLNYYLFQCIFKNLM